MNRISRRELLYGLGASALLPIVSRVPTVKAADGLPNILVIVADALSARHMSLYDYPLDNTPNFNRLAERATVFHNHYAGGNYTAPGTASLLTGTLPWTNRTFNMRGEPADSVVDLGIFNQFAQAGYHTLGFTQNVIAAIVMNKLGGMDKMFPFNAWHLHHNRLSDPVFRLPDDDYQLKSMVEHALITQRNGSLFTSFWTDVWELWQTRRSLKQEQNIYPLGYPQFADTTGSFRFDEVVDGIMETVLNLPEPYFSYVHFFPPHDPYRPTQPSYDAFKNDVQDIPTHPPTPFDHTVPRETVLREQNYYDAFIADVDAEFGRIIQKLEDAGKLDNTWVVFTSDHGELFSTGHATHLTHLLSDDLIRVPLVIFSPNQTERRDVRQVTSCIDLLPTLLNAAGMTANNRHEGSLLPGFGGDETADRSAFAVEAKRLNRNAPLTKMTSLAMRHGQYKLERYIGYEGVDDFHRVFDLENDPLETNDISESERGVAADLLDLLHNIVVPYQ